MTGLLVGPLTDPGRPGAVRADLAGVVPQVLGPARVWPRISQCDRTGDPGPPPATSGPEHQSTLEFEAAVEAAVEAEFEADA
jgi:hypothetical protein